MNEIFAWVLETGWQAAVMALVVAAVLLVAGGRIPPAWRYAMMFLIVVRLLLPMLPSAPVSGYRVVPATPAKAWEQALPSRPVPDWMEHTLPAPGAAAPARAGPVRGTRSRRVRCRGAARARSCG